MKKSAYQNRVAILREKMADMTPDTLWIIQPENRRYLSGFKAPDMQLNESSGSLLITEKDALLVTDSRYTTEAEKEAVGFETVTHQKALQESLPAILASLRTRNLGFEEGFVTWGFYRELSKNLKRPSVLLKHKLPVLLMVTQLKLILLAQYVRFAILV